VRWREPTGVFLGAALDVAAPPAHDCVVTTVDEVIELAAQLSEEERRVVVDAIAPKESVQQLSQAWTEEIARRAAHVRAGESKGRPGDEVFDRIEAKLRGR
jgi:putative addiction module component (TIGR02574 family)